MSGIHYFVVRGHRDWDHDGDKWLGIFDDPKDIKRCFEEAMLELAHDKEEEKLVFEKKGWGLGFLEDTSEIMISAFDEDMKEWTHDICPDDL